jgi:hypothetical protein
MRKRSQIKKRPDLKKGLSNSLTPRSGRKTEAVKIHNSTDNRGRVIENGQVVRCPVCHSSKVIRELSFDYIKTCRNNKCSYYANSPKKWRNNFITGVHN